MQLGCCCPIEQSDIARRAGFDFVEPTMLSLQAADSTVDFQAVLSLFQASALPTSSFNIFLPATLSVCGLSVDWSAVEAYVKDALRRVQAVGGKCVVFGSTASRQTPDGFDRSDAEDQLVRFLRIAGAIAEPLELASVIEPLNTEETNTINSVTEGASFARKVDHPAVRLLEDLYHMQVEHEPLDHLAQYGEWIQHIHVADS